MRPSATAITTRHGSTRSASARTRLRRASRPRSRHAGQAGEAAMQVSGRIVVVTGGGNGIGKALCERFHAEGAARVVVVDLEQESAERTARAVDGLAFAVDVRDEAQIAAMVAAVEEQFGRIDLFCSNAGIIAGDGEPWHATSAPNVT